MTQLTDKLLIESLLAYVDGHPSEAQFLKIGETSKARDLKTLREMVVNETCPPQCLTTLKPKFIQNFWKHLLTDAINVLKWYDTREVLPEDKVGALGKPKITYRKWLDKTFGNVAFGIDELDKYFKQFVEFEQVLYGAERYYRDHFPHVVRVWLIGMYVMTTPGFLPAEDLSIKFADLSERKEKVLEISTPERLAIWTLIALCHDLGYPLQKISSINTPLRAMLDNVGKAQVQDFAYEFPRQHQFIDDFIMRFISSRLCEPTRHSDGKLEFKTEIQTKYYLKLSKSFEELQHGILSCTLLMKRLVYFLESDLDISPQKKLDKEDARQFAIRREILRSIAVHTCSDIYHLSSNVFSFLLIVCDDVQEWDRPTFPQMRGQEQRTTNVCLNKYSAAEVDVCVFYPAQESMSSDEFEQDRAHYARSVFQRLHKILRSAVYVHNKTFRCTWTIKLEFSPGKSPIVMVFTNEKNAASLTINGKPDQKWLYNETAKLSKYMR